MSNRNLSWLNVAGVAVFGYFAWLQLDDSNPAIYEHASAIDAWSWIAFYGLIAMCFGLAIFRRFPWVLYLAAAVFCVFELISTGPGVVANLTNPGGFTMTKSAMNPDQPQVELSREFFGAVIALVGVGLLVVQRRSWERRPDKMV